MNFFLTGNGRWMAQQGTVQYYLFLCKVGKCSFYTMHRVINSNFNLEAIRTIGTYKSLKAAKNAAENDLLQII